MKLSLQDYISIKIHKTDLALTSSITAILAPYNIAPEQNLIMMLLWEKDGLSQNYIVEKLEKDKTNIARMASNLEKKGFISRVNCQDDRRSVKLYLTSTGRELGEKVIPLAEKFNDIVCDGITQDDLLALDRILTKIKGNVQNSN